MKICVCGKGGSGKSTVVALLAHAFRERGKQAIVLDSDESNTSLYWMLGFDAPPLPLMDFVGGKKKVQQGMMARFSKGEDEPAMSIWEIDVLASRSIPPEYVVESDGIKLVSTGKIHQALEGCACPMGTVTREFLKKFQLTEQEILLVDMEAGIEHFGRGIEAWVDGVISVVEPSLESMMLAEKVMELTRSAGADFYGVLLNKMSSREQQQVLQERLIGLAAPILGAVGFHDALQTACLEGKRLRSAMCPEIRDLSDALLRKPEKK